MNGPLWLVVGASGAGKDSLLRRLAQTLRAGDHVHVARRWITRGAHASEDHQAIDDAGFDAMLARGEFALHWAAHGARYGIGREIDAWLAAGDTVVVNGSRAHLPTAFALYPQARAIEVRVNPAVLAERLAARGREDEAQIAERLARHAELAAQTTTDPRIVVLDNNGTLDAATVALHALMTGAPLPAGAG